MIPLLFFCSGATALIYEVVWAKYLSLMFGSTIQAQTVVLAVFMGGLALGNSLFGRRADWLKQPLVAYGYVEVIIGLYAFFFDWIYTAADVGFIKLGGPLLNHTGGLLALKAMLSIALLLGPTLLMGGTLPLLAAWLQNTSIDASRRSARFYSINSLGAVCGAGLAGFVLVVGLGLVATLQATALINVLIGIAAVGLARSSANTAEPARKKNAHASSPNETSTSVLARWAWLVVALTGAVSMGLEVLASRSIALIVGPSSQAFALVLMAFILGIGIGSAIVASPRLSNLTSEITVARLLLGAGVAVGLYVLGIEKWLLIYTVGRSGLAPTEMGYVYHQLLVGGMAIVVLGIPAGLLGAVLPLCIRLVGGGSHALGGEVGRLLTWNTVGAVAGVLVTGFLLMPGAGLRGALVTVAVLLAAAATLAAWVGQARGFATVTLLVCIGFGFAAARTGEGWQQVVGSGVFRARTALTQQGLDLRRKSTKMLFYKDSADATVSVETSVEGRQKGELVLRINGKPDASTKGDLSTQYLLAHLPMLARPESKEVFVLGFGSGITAGALLGHPLDRITLAENCRPVLEAGKLFEPWNRGVLTNSRTRVLSEDARTVLKLDPQQYDIVISEPSNPWVAGIGSVFSREFYELAASRLKPGGIMAQWFHIYEVHDGLVMLVLRTFQSVFPHVEIWESQKGDIILLGSLSPWESSLAKFQRVYERPTAKADLERVGLPAPASVYIRQLASQRITRAIAGDGAIQSDYFPSLEYLAPKSFFMGVGSVQLHLFDERSWQSAFVDDERRRALRSLPMEALGPLFLEFGTGNVELQQYVTWRSEQASRPDKETIYRAHPYTPFIFREPGSYPRQMTPPQGASPQLIQMMNALALLSTEPSRSLESIDQIESIIRAQVRTSAGGSVTVDWRPGFYGSVAARACLALGHIERARSVVEDAFKIDPEDLQLQFLKRLLTQSPIRN